MDKSHVPCTSRSMPVLLTYKQTKEQSKGDVRVHYFIMCKTVSRRELYMLSVIISPIVVYLVKQMNMHKSSLSIWLAGIWRQVSV